MKQFVISRTMEERPDSEVELVSDDVPGLVRKLKEQAGKGVYLCGGAKLAGALFSEGLIRACSETQLRPIWHIPLFETIGRIVLMFHHSNAYDNGMLLLHYHVQ